MSAASTRPSLSVTNTVTVENANTVTVENAESSQSQTLVLRLKRRKKKVSWKEGTVDNEFMQKKSSKKCCIFHKQKPFDEDVSDDEEHDDNHRHHHDHDCNDAAGSSTSG